MMLTDWRFCLPSRVPRARFLTLHMEFTSTPRRASRPRHETRTSDSLCKSVSRERPAHRGLSGRPRVASGRPRGPPKSKVPLWAEVPRLQTLGLFAQKGGGECPLWTRLNAWSGPQGPLIRAGQRAQGLSIWVLALCHLLSLPRRRAASQGTELDGCSGTPISLFP